MGLPELLALLEEPAAEEGGVGSGIPATAMAVTAAMAVKLLLLSQQISMPRLLLSPHQRLGPKQP